METMNERMHTVRLIRPFNHRGTLYQGKCELTHDAYERACDYGLVDGETTEAKHPKTPEKPEEDNAKSDVDSGATTNDSQDSTKTPAEESETVDREADIDKAIIELRKAEPNKKPNVADIEKLIGYDITAKERDARFKIYKASARPEDRNAARQIQQR